MATSTMRAVVLDAPGPAGAPQIRELPIPTPGAGRALIAVHAFGLNRAEFVEAHQAMEDGTTSAELVLTTGR